MQSVTDAPSTASSPFATAGPGNSDGRQWGLLMAATGKTPAAPDRARHVALAALLAWF